MSITRLPKVLFLIPHLGGGGAERVTALLAEGLSPSKYEVHLGLVTQSDPGDIPLSQSVRVHALGASRVRLAAFRLFRLVRRVQPDLILSSMAHLNFLVALIRPLFPLETHLVLRQNGTASAALASSSSPACTRLLYRLLYPRADCVICQTPAMALDLAAILGRSRIPMPVLPNPIDIEGIAAALRSPQDSGEAHTPWPDCGPHLLAIGRLSPEKGFDLLLEALVQVRNRFPCADLLIAGVGPEETALKAQCHRLRIDSAVNFAGHLDLPARLFPSAALFVLPSRHEGLPNALLEAAAGGLPVVATPASGGLVDLLRHQPGAWLASAVSSSAIAESLIDALHALQPGQRFEHSFLKPFRLDRAIAAYEELIDSILAQPPRRPALSIKSS